MSSEPPPEGVGSPALAGSRWQAWFGQSWLSPTRLPSVLFWVSMAVLSWLYVRPVWLTQFPPGTDLAGHVAVVAIMRNLGAVGHTQALMFSWGSFPVPNCLYYLTTYVFSFPFGVLTANQLVLSLYAVGLPLSFLAFSREFRINRWLALFVFLLIYDFNHTYGFVAYSTSLPFLFLALAWARRLSVEPSIRHWLMAALGGILVYFTHVQTYVAFCFFATALYLVHIQWERRTPLMERVPESILSLMPGATSVIPSLLLFLPWFYRVFLSPEASKVPLGFGKLEKSKMFFDSWEERIAKFFDHTGNALHGDADSKPFVVAAVVALIAIAGIRGREFLSWAERWELTVLLMLALAGYFLLPAHMTGQAEIYNRFGVVVCLMFVAWIRNVPYKSGGSFAVFFALPLLAANYAFAQSYYDATKHYAREVDGFRETLASAKPGSRLTHMFASSADSSSHIRGSVFRHFVDYHYVLNGGITHDSFAQRPGRIVGYRPPKHPSVFYYSPKWYKNSRLWKHYDYVLTIRFVPPGGPTPDGIELVAQHGIWGLYRKAPE